MEKICLVETTTENLNQAKDNLARGTSRRSFLRMAALTGTASALAAPVLLSGCGGGSSTPSTFNGNGGDLGQGDTAILNTFYALKQLTSTFYSMVVGNFYTGISAAETEGLTDIYQHELAHLNFLKQILGAQAIPTLSNFDLATLNFDNRDTILSRARQFEDVCSCGFNGAGRFIVDPANVLLLQKMGSVDARHAAIIRDYIDPITSHFAENGIANGTTGSDGQVDPDFLMRVVRSYNPSPFIDSGDLA